MLGKSGYLDVEFFVQFDKLAARESAGPTGPLAPVDDDSNRVRTP